ncbi:hypothetical protein KJR35_06655 [Streptococcus lutetiensis]|uniref:hypothetical protein n=1 Tax=Streptococcus lutetiensis TaxID=150055 RepID=UPI0015F2C1ED|nr:hypothetical protein [Streptococcus lutetiensis]MBT0902354.1 hypothetical protein [Streptococcus lutetiensis]
MEGKRGSECLLKPVSNIDFNPINLRERFIYTKDLTVSFLEIIVGMIIYAMFTLILRVPIIYEVRDLIIKKLRK